MIIIDPEIEHYPKDLFEAKGKPIFSSIIDLPIYGFALFRFLSDGSIYLNINDKYTYEPVQIFHKTKKITEDINGRKVVNTIKYFIQSNKEYISTYKLSQFLQEVELNEGLLIHPDNEAWADERNFLSRKLKKTIRKIDRGTCYQYDYPQSLHREFWIRPKINENLFLEFTPTVDLSKSELITLNKLTQEKLISYFTDQISLDIETFDSEIPKGPGGLLWWKGQIRLIQIYSIERDKCLVIDFGNRYNRFKIPSWFTDTFNQGQQRCSKILGQNLLFDYSFLSTHLGVKIEYANILDLMVISQNFYAGLETLSHSLESISKRNKISTDKLFQKEDFGARLSPLQYKYGIDDTICVYQNYLELKKKYQDSLTLHNEPCIVRDCKFYAPLLTVRTKGWHVNLAQLQEYKQWIEDYLEKAAQKFCEITGLESPSVSAKQTLTPYYQSQNLKIYDTKKETLKKFVALHPSIQHLLDWRSAKQLQSQILSIESAIVDGSFKAVINPLATQGMGRTSSSGFISGSVGTNIQNIRTFSKDYPNFPNIRNIFQAHEGYKYIVADYNAAHLRIAAYLTQSIELLDGFLKGDVHSVNAFQLSKELQSGFNLDTNTSETFKSLDDFKSKYKNKNNSARFFRDLAKTVIYLFINMGGPDRLQGVFADEGKNIGTEQCKHIINIFKRGPAGPVRNWVYGQQNRTDEITLSFDEFYNPIKENLEETKDNLYTILLSHTGRYVYLHKKYRKKEFGTDIETYYICSAQDISAHLWQSVEADIIKTAAIQAHKVFVQHPEWDAWICGLVHDELVGIGKSKYAIDISQTIHKAMSESWDQVIPGVGGFEDIPDIHMSFIQDSWTK